MTIKEISNYLETVAPLSYQESYDNAGLLCGDASEVVTGILCTLDCVESVVEEAMRRGCNLIVAHHPIVFSGIKKLTGKNYVERTLLKAIKNNIAIYAIHTNLDHVLSGVNAMIGKQLALQNLRMLAPKKQLLKKLTVFVPPSHTEILLDALAKAGAGQIGNYSHCSFAVQGEGRFKPNEKAQPYIGQAHYIEKVQETRIEVVLPTYAEQAVLAAMKQAHPYEAVAYFLHLLENENQEVGAGMVGELPNAMTATEFLQHLKASMKLKVIRHTQVLEKPVSKVAICGGAGSFLLKNAVAAKADVFVTADYKYHEFFDAEANIMVADIGHYESEQYTKELLRDLLVSFLAAYNNKQTKVFISEVNTNPIDYFF
jgi:dinuclear metal center YbgI/SA1388 family protein